MNYRRERETRHAPPTRRRKREAWTAWNQERKKPEREREREREQSRFVLSTILSLLVVTFYLGEKRKAEKKKRKETADLKGAATHCAQEQRKKTAGVTRRQESEIWVWFVGDGNAWREISNASGRKQKFTAAKPPRISILRRSKEKGAGRGEERRGEERRGEEKGNAEWRRERPVLTRQKGRQGVAQWVQGVIRRE